MSDFGCSGERRQCWRLAQGSRNPTSEIRNLLEKIMSKSKTLIIAISLAGAALAQPSHSVTAAMVESWMTELSNWGRWGKQDQMGAANLITPAKRRQAASLVKDGVSVSLAAIPKRRGRRQRLAVRAHYDFDGKVPARRRLQHGRNQRLLPRLGAHPHGLAVPHVLQGQDVQWLPAGGCYHSGRDQTGGNEFPKTDFCRAAS